MDTVFDPLLGTLRMSDAAALPAVRQSATAAVTPKNGAIVTYSVVGGEVFTIDRSGFAAGSCVTFELWINNPSGSSFTLPSDLVWIDGSAPDMSAAAMYVLVIRWDGSRLLGNLAYSIDLSGSGSSGEEETSGSGEEPSSSSSSSSSGGTSGGTSAYVAYGAGSTSVHGLYKEAGTYNAKPYYDYAFAYNGGTGHYYMYFNLSYGWVIATALPGGSETPVIVYHSGDPLDPTPDATTWTNVFGNGTAPAPTVAMVQDYTTTHTPGTASFGGTYTYDASASGNGKIIRANGSGCHMVASDKSASGIMSIYLYKPEVTSYAGMSTSSYYWASSSATGAETPATVTFSVNTLSGPAAGVSPAPTFAEVPDAAAQ